MALSCRFQPLFRQRLSSGVRAVRMNAKQDVLIFITAELAFTENAVKKASIFYQLYMFFSGILHHSDSAVFTLQTAMTKRYRTVQK
jgi:hypothetical protein